MEATPTSPSQHDPDDLPYEVSLDELSEVAAAQMHPPEQYDGQMGVLNEFVETTRDDDPAEDPLPERRRRGWLWTMVVVFGMVCGAALLWLLIVLILQ